MKRTFLACLLACLALSALAPAVPAATLGGPGFHTPAAPIGVRQWFNDKLGGDLGINVESDKHENPGYTSDRFLLDLGLPYCVARLDKLHFIVRPGFEWSTDKETSTGNPDVTYTSWLVLGELEAEYRLTDKFSVSLSHGFAYASREDDRTPKSTETQFETFGNSLIGLGFHVYLW